MVVEMVDAVVLEVVVVIDEAMMPVVVRFGLGVVVLSP